MSAAAAPRPPELLVAAAADLASVQEPLADAFLRATGQRVRLVLASSGMLARQIEQGAPYDVYLSANEQFVAELAASGRLLEDSVRTYALGRIALWSKDGSVRNLDDLLAERVRHIGVANPTHAPYGVAALQALEKRGLRTRLEPKIVYGENVRQALQYAESGNAEAAITAWSLVIDRGGILLPLAWHVPIRQAAAIVKGTKQLQLARRFLAFLASPDTARLLEKHGLYPPRPAPGARN